MIRTGDVKIRSNRRSSAFYNYFYVFSTHTHTHTRRNTPKVKSREEIEDKWYETTLISFNNQHVHPFGCLQLLINFWAGDSSLHLIFNFRICSWLFISILNGKKKDFISLELYFCHFYHTKIMCTSIYNCIAAARLDSFFFIWLLWIWNFCFSGQ